ncbi:hypothetical protein AAE478_008713 [Parahypoxylon ruwenzoriense]
MPSLNSWFYRFLEDYVYAKPEPPPRKRTKPMEVLCVGFPRCGTESLQHALLKLGYDYTYHGWDIIFGEPNYAPQWVRLCRRKWFGAPDGENTITREEFNAVLGHSVAVTGAAGSVFAADIIAAYPEAKVILNYRRDINAWHNSAINTLARSSSNWAIWAMSYLSRDLFWSWHCYVRFMFPGLFRALDGNIWTGIARNGKWAHREHNNMVRGLVPKERLLEWTVEDGWGPLCEFLDKPVPDEPFPHANAAAGWQAKEVEVSKKYLLQAVQTLAVLSSIAAGAGAISYKYLLLP